MPASRLIILGVAIAAAGGAGYVAKNMVAPAPVEQKAGAPAPAIATTDVLTLNTDVPLGESVEGKLEWRQWPSNAVAGGFITRDAKPEGLNEFGKAIARVSLYAGEPLRESKLASGRTILSTLLPSGKRAVATQISAETSAGGFILPNDYVDVIMVRRTETTGTQGFTTETILKNIKVLAIDQTIQENEQGEKTKVGSTATLELTPEQAEIITVAQQMADRLALTLRSLADSQERTTGEADYLVSGSGKAGTIRLIKSGEVSEVGARK